MQECVGRFDETQLFAEKPWPYQPSLYSWTMRCSDWSSSVAHKCAADLAEQPARKKNLHFPRQDLPILDQKMPPLPWRKCKGRSSTRDGEYLSVQAAKNTAGTDTELDRHAAGIDPCLLPAAPARLSVVDSEVAALAKTGLHYDGGAKLCTFFRALAAHARPSACKAQELSIGKQARAHRKNAPSVLQRRQRPHRPATASNADLRVFCSRRPAPGR